MARPVSICRPAIDVHLNLAVGIVPGQIQQLSDDQVGDDVIDGRAEKDDAVLLEQREDVVPALPTAGLLDHHRDGIRKGLKRHWQPLSLLANHFCASALRNADRPRPASNARRDRRPLQSDDSLRRSAPRATRTRCNWPDARPAVATVGMDPSCLARLSAQRRASGLVEAVVA
jgi:hypothetical protein